MDYFFPKKTKIRKLEQELNSMKLNVPQMQRSRTMTGLAPIPSGCPVATPPHQRRNVEIFATDLWDLVPKKTIFEKQNRNSRTFQIQI